MLQGSSDSFYRIIITCALLLPVSPLHSGFFFLCVQVKVRHDRAVGPSGTDHLT